MGMGVWPGNEDISDNRQLNDLAVVLPLHEYSDGTRSPYFIIRHP